jgi:guanylate kinase
MEHLSTYLYRNKPPSLDVSSVDSYDYNPNSSINSSQSVMLTGAPATGKSTVMRELLQDHNFTPSPDITTRPIRANEIDGVDKRFVTVNEFTDLYSNDRLIEPSLDYCNYQGNYYGSPVEWLDGEELGDLKVLTCVAAMIAKRVRERNKNILWVHLESEDSARASRLALRGISRTAIIKRLNNSGGDSHVTPAEADLSIDTSRLTLPQTIDHILEAI